MALSMKVISITMISTELEYTFGQTSEIMRENGNVIKCTAKGSQGFFPRSVLGFEAHPVLEGGDAHGEEGEEKHDGGPPELLVLAQLDGNGQVGVHVKVKHAKLNEDIQLRGRDVLFSIVGNVAILIFELHVGIEFVLADGLLGADVLLSEELRGLIS